MNNTTIRVYKYEVTLKHDNGTINLTTTATSEDIAIANVLEAEGAPLTAVTGAKRLGPVLR